MADSRDLVGRISLREVKLYHQKMLIVSPAQDAPSVRRAAAAPYWLRFGDGSISTVVMIAHESHLEIEMRMQKWPIDRILTPRIGAAWLDFS